jgi:PilZ domain
MEEFGEDWDREVDKEFRREFDGDFSGGFEGEAAGSGGGKRARRKPPGSVSASGSDNSGAIDSSPSSSRAIDSKAIKDFKKFLGEDGAQHGERRDVSLPEAVEAGQPDVTIAERRQHTRYSVDALVEVLVADGSILFRGRVRDISLAGCYIETEARLRMRPGSIVEMVFRLESSVFRLVAASKMLRPGKGAGFLFLKMDRAMRASLDALIEELGKPAA